MDVVHSFVGRTITEVTSRRNQFTPVYRLPNELFSHIFEFANERPRDQSNRPIGWNVSEVSRRWRQIALHTPRLWSTIDVLDQRFIDLCISRSGKVSLDIELDTCLNKVVPSERKMEDYVASLVPHIGRWRTLKLHHEITPAFLHHLSSPAPKLHHLELAPSFHHINLLRITGTPL